MKEDLYTEFKREWKDEYLRNVAAFANTNGGVIHVGIDDAGVAYGVENLTKDLKTIPDKIQSSLGIVPIIDHYMMDGKNCISITVRKSSESIFYGGKLWVKSGSTTRALSGSELRDRLLRDHNISWTDLTLDGVGPDALSKEAILYFMKASKKISHDVDSISDSDVKNILINLGMMDGGCITKAAAILFHPEPWKVVTDAYLKIGEFDEKNELLREEYVRCPLIMMPEKASEIIFDKFIPGHFDYNQMQRKMVYRYPLEAVREILINAIIHNDYSVGWPIEVRILPNGMSVFNYGELPEGWDIDTLLNEHPSAPRNRRLAEAFHEAGFIEKWGKGIGMVLETCVNAGLPKPTFETYFKGLRVTFIDKEEKEPGPSIELTESHMAVLDAIKNGCRTRLAISEFTGLTNATIKRNLHDLIASERIRREGSNKRGYWLILDKENN